MNLIAPHITAFLRQYLLHDRKASRNTCDAYAYAFQLLFEFASGHLNIRPSELHLEQIDAPLVLAFLEHLQENRKNCPRTRNARLAAIKSFMGFVEYRVPEALDQVRRVLSIPIQRTDTPLVRHLAVEECQALLDAPAPETRLGIRDRAMLHLAVTGGLRVSELVGLRMADVTFESRYVHIHVQGKGRKERLLVLWQAVADSLRAWLAVRGEASAPELFLNARGKPLTRAGFGWVLKKHISTAVSRHSSIQGKRVSPHVLRHTCAINTLQATGDIRKVALWLGHASMQTTEIYLQADPSQKIEALNTMTPPMLRPGKFRPSDKLLALLKDHDYVK